MKNDEICKIVEYLKSMGISTLEDFKLAFSGNDTFKFDLSIISNKFYLAEDFEEFTVPDFWEHSTLMASFRRGVLNQNYKYNVMYLDQSISDKSFGMTSYRLKAKEKFKVKVFRIIPGKIATYEECLEFLKIQGAVFTGAHGLIQFFRQKLKDLSEDCNYISLDRKEYLGKIDGYSNFLILRRIGNQGEQFSFYPSPYHETFFNHETALLCFLK